MRSDDWEALDPSKGASCPLTSPGISMFACRAPWAAQVLLTLLENHFYQKPAEMQSLGTALLVTLKIPGWAVSLETKADAVRCL